MKTIFWIRFITYKTDKQKILFAQKFLKKIFANNWFNFRKKKQINLWYNLNMLIICKNSWIHRIYM